MEGLWWLIAIVLFLLFGKNLNLTSFKVGNNTAVPDGTFNNPNAVPTPDGIAAISIQNQVSPPENQPAPWKSVCSSPVNSQSPTNPVFNVATVTPVQAVSVQGTAIQVTKTAA
jgi:hypothetical protein